MPSASNANEPANRPRRGKLSVRHDGSSVSQIPISKPQGNCKLQTSNSLELGIWCLGFFRFAEPSRAAFN